MRLPSDPVPAGVPRSRPDAAARLVLALVLALVLGALAGCSSDDSEKSGESGASRSGDARGVPELAVRTRVVRVAGELGERGRAALADEVRRVVTRYVRAAFLADEAGEVRVAGAFPGFTPGARKLAVRDARLLTSARWPEADEIRPVAARADVAILSPGGTPAGATVLVSVTFEVTTGDDTRRQGLRGRLMLTPARDRWRVFGYDLVQTDGGGKRHPRPRSSR